MGSSTPAVLVNEYIRELCIELGGIVYIKDLGYSISMGQDVRFRVAYVKGTDSGLTFITEHGSIFSYGIKDFNHMIVPEGWSLACDLASKYTDMFDPVWESDDCGIIRRSVKFNPSFWESEE